MFLKYYIPIYVLAIVVLLLVAGCAVKYDVGCVKPRYVTDATTPIVEGFDSNFVLRCD